MKRYSTIAAVIVIVTLGALGVLSSSMAAQAPDRTKLPPPGPPPPVQLPTIQKRQLSNGLPVWLVELHEVPVAQVNLVVLRGSADDPAGKFGVATLTAAMLQEGAGTRVLARARRRHRFPRRRSQHHGRDSTPPPFGCTCRSRAWPMRCR